MHPPGRPRPPHLSPPQPLGAQPARPARRSLFSRPGPVPPHPSLPGEGCARRQGGEAGQPIDGRIRNRVSPAPEHPQRQPRGAPGRRPAAGNPDLSACHMKTIIASAGGGEEKLKAVRRRSGGQRRPPPSHRPQRHMHPTGQPGAPADLRHRHCGGLNSPIYVELGFAWQRQQAESLGRVATAKEGGEGPPEPPPRGAEALTEPLPPPAAAALSTRRSRAASCVLRRGSLSVCEKNEMYRNQAREGAQPSAPAATRVLAAAGKSSQGRKRPEEPVPPSRGRGGR